MVIFFSPLIFRLKAYVLMDWGARADGRRQVDIVAKTWMVDIANFRHPGEGFTSTSIESAMFAQMTPERDWPSWSGMCVGSSGYLLLK